MTCIRIPNGIVTLASGMIPVRIPYRGTVYVEHCRGGGIEVWSDRDGDRAVDWTARGNGRIRKAVMAAVGRYRVE